MDAEGKRDSFQNYMGQSAHIDRLQKDFSNGTFTHAYLFTGPAGTGKKSVARLCAQAALCRGSGERPCGVCGPCRRVLARSHPDLHILEPEEGKKGISVEQMRLYIQETNVMSFEDGFKVFYIPNAEKMNTNAQNTLLKTLEEPPDGTVFLLVTVHTSSLLPTIVSRCRNVRFHPLTDEQTQARLRELGIPESEIELRARISEGCVGQALSYNPATLQKRGNLAKTFFSVRGPQDVLPLVMQYKEEKDRDNRQQTLELLEEIIREIILVQAGDGDPSVLMPEIQSYAEHVPLEGGLALSAQIAEAKKMLASNVTFQSALETVLLKISEEYRKWPW